MLLKIILLVLLFVLLYFFVMKYLYTRESYINISNQFISDGYVKGILRNSKNRRNRGKRVYFNI
jgi:hypothetical protein